jgi:hypothetical protein
MLTLNRIATFGDRLSLSFLRFCHGNAGVNGVASRSWAKCLLETHHLHG